MASTSAVHLMMRKRRAATLVEERADGVSTERSPEAVTVRLDADGTRVAAITDANPGSDSPEIRLEYVTDGKTSVARAVDRVRRLLSRHER